MRSKSDNANAIDKTLIILSAFAPRSQGWGTVELSLALGFHKATVSRILLTLTRHGFLIQDPQTKKFTLGPEVIRLSKALCQSLRTNIVYIAKPFVDELRDRIKETVILEILSGTSSFMAYVAEGPRMVRLAGAIGDPIPIHAAAGGKAIIAFLSEEHRKVLLNGRLTRYTKNTITSQRELEKELAGIRKTGVARDREEIDEGTSAVACPVFDYENKPVASVIVAGPNQRIEEYCDSLFTPALKEATVKISRALLWEEGQIGQGIKTPYPDN